MMAKRRSPPATRPPPTDNANLLLAALPADEYKRIRQSLDVIPLKLKTLLHRSGEPIEHVYFPGYRTATDLLLAVTAGRKS